MAEYLKKPLPLSLNTVAQQQALDAINQAGRALPCHVTSVVSSGIVTVAFDVDATPFTLPQVTVPIEYPEYIRYPIQVGDKGMVFPADARLGYAAGLGGGVPTLSKPSNLSALSFVWLGSALWSATDDPNAVVIYGPNGVVLRDSSHSTTLTLTPSGVNIDGSLATTGNLSAGNGITCSFTTLTGQVVTVQNGIVTNLY